MQEKLEKTYFIKVIHIERKAVSTDLCKGLMQMKINEKNSSNHSWILQ